MAENEVVNASSVAQADPADKGADGKNVASATPPSPPQKHIKDTVGAKIVNFFTFYVVGFFANVSMSLFITYGLNPRPSVKAAKERIAKGIAGLAGKDEAGSGILDSVRSGIEISFMMIAGTIAAGIMTPMLKYRDQLSYKINKMLGKDTDVLPDNLKKLPEPRTAEERIQREIDSKVHRNNASISALWLSRFGVVGSILAGDALVNRGNRMLESHKLPSVDTLSWASGKQLYKLMPKKAVAAWDNWFTKHGAGLRDIKHSSPEHYARLEEHGKVGRDDSSMVISEQTRLVIKEVGWSYVAASFVESMTNFFRDKIVDRQIKKGIQSATDKGLVPEGHRVVVDKHGKVSLDKVESKEHALEPGYWTSKEAATVKERAQPQKAESYAKTVTEGRAAGDGQPAIQS